MSCLDVSASDLIDRISIETFSNTVSSLGVPEQTWSELAEVGAKIEWTSGDEKDLITKENAVTNVTFTIRYRSDVNTKQRILHDGDYFDILTILTIGRKQFQTIKTQLVL